MKEEKLEDGSVRVRVQLTGDGVRQSELSIAYDKRLSLINFAADWGSVDNIRRLLNNGTDVTEQNADRRMSLHLAAQRGLTEAVTYLLERGAHIISRDNKGRTALWYACYGVHLNLVKLFLEKGADSTVVDNSGYTALHAAMSRFSHHHHHHTDPSDARSDVWQS
jgi:FOG: Ankyrin repeat